MGPPGKLEFEAVDALPGALRPRFGPASSMRIQRFRRRLEAVAQAKAAAALKAAREGLAHRPAAAPASCLRPGGRAEGEDRSAPGGFPVSEPTPREVAEMLRAFHSDLRWLTEEEQAAFTETVRLFLGGWLARDDWRRAARAVKALAASR